MDFLVEIIMELLFEVPLEAAMESKKLKKCVKTAIFCIICGGITALFAVITALMWLDNDDTGAFFMTLMTMGMLAMTIFGAVRGHNRNWKT